MSRKKELLTAIASTEASIQKKLVKISGHQLYFSQLFANNGVLLAVMLLPSFLVGWKMAKVVPKGQLISQFFRFSLITAMNVINK